MLVPLLTVLMRGVSVRLSLLVFAQVVMMRCLVMMVSGGVMVSGGLVMMLARRMLSHGVYSQPGREGGIAGRNPNLSYAFGNKMDAILAGCAARRAAARTDVDSIAALRNPDSAASPAPTAAPTAAGRQSVAAKLRPRMLAAIPLRARNRLHLRKRK